MNSYLLIFFAIIFSAFFSGMEIAFVTSNKLRIELDRKQGAFGSGITRFFAMNPGQYIATMLIGNNISLVVYGLIISKLLNPVIYPLVESDILTLIIQTIISTGIILFVAEFLPKVIFLLNPNFFLTSLSIPTLLFYALFYPVSKLTLVASNYVIRLFSGIKSVEKRQEDIVFSKVDLDHFISQSKKHNKENESDQRNIRIFQNALDFSNVRARECMIPRTEIEAIDIVSDIKTLREKFIETRLSRILVYQDTIDHISGYFELKDLFKNPPDICSGMRKLAIIPESMPANKLLSLFVQEKKNIAVVVDEFGGTSGMVTIEDVLEEIVGDIEDEHDTNEMVERKVNTNEYVFSGRLEIDYLNEKYGLGLPEEDDYETLAGMILYYHGNIPNNNDIIRINNIVVKILRATCTRLDLVNLKVE
jgi:CBS domain containing-hemolysin-like protein